MAGETGDDASWARALPFQISVEDIDRLLTSDAAISRSSLWVPQSVQAADACEAGLASHAAGAWRSEARPIQTAVGRGKPVHSIASHGLAALPGSASGAQSASFEMGAPTECGELPPAQPSYGSVHAEATTRATSGLPPRYKRIEKVALTIGIMCSMVFVVSLSDQKTASGRSSSTLAGRGNKLVGAGCTAFLCPTSGHCATGASKCPEGNPFLKDGSIYRDLAECRDTSRPCNFLDGAGGTVAFADKAQVIALKTEGHINGAGFKSCDGFLCPMSGSCQVTPANCSEGDPFAKHSSPYWKDLLAAKKQLIHLPADVNAKEPSQTLQKTIVTGIAVKGIEDQGSGTTLQHPPHGSKSATKVAAAALPARASAKELEAQEVASEAASLEKSDAAIAASIYDHAAPTTRSQHGAHETGTEPNKFAAAALHGSGKVPNLQGKALSATSKVGVSKSSEAAQNKLLKFASSVDPAAPKS